MTYSIIKRKLKDTEIKILVQEIKNTPNISAYSKLEWQNCENLFVAENADGQMIGACLNDDFFSKWTEIAALFVLEEYRNLGIGKKLFIKSLEDSIDRRRNILVMSGNPFVVKMMKEQGLTIFNSLKKLPRPFNKYAVVLNYFYEIRWFLNWYRIVEIIRKKLIFRSKSKYTYGLMLNN